MRPEIEQIRAIIDGTLNNYGFVSTNARRSACKTILDKLGVLEAALGEAESGVAPVGFYLDMTVDQLRGHCITSNAEEFLTYLQSCIRPVLPETVDDLPYGSIEDIAAEACGDYDRTFFTVTDPGSPDGDSSVFTPFHEQPGRSFAKPPIPEPKDQERTQTTPFPPRPRSVDPNNTNAHEERMLKWFTYDHLPANLQAASAPWCELAVLLCHTTKPGPERTVALRKLLEGKDAAVRATLQPGA